MSTIHIVRSVILTTILLKLLKIFSKVDQMKTAFHQGSLLSIIGLFIAGIEFVTGDIQ